MKLDTEKTKLKLPALSLPPDLIIIVCAAASALLFVAGLFVPVPAELKTFIFACCVILTGYDILIDTATGIIREHDFNENLLVVVAAAAAFFIGKGIEGAAAMILFRTGELLHTKLVKRSANVVEMLIDLRPETVNAVINGAIVQMAPGKISVGDIISVSPGERIALDGVVISGESELDLTGLSGDIVHKNVTEGSDVLSGSINLTGLINIRATADFDHSTVSRILKIVEEAEKKKSGLERFLRRLGRIYTPAAIAAALIIGVAVPLIGGLPLNNWLGRALGMLIISGPAALMIPVALTYFAGIGGAARKGILFRGAQIVDTVAHTTSVVFDKTGTLTDGEFQVVDINAYGIPEKRLLMLAAYAELYSNHPIALSIVAKADTMPDFTRVSDYREFNGKGVEIEIGGNTVSAGNALFMTELGITPDISQAEASVVYIAVNGKYAGRILLRDTIKADARKAIKDLHAIGIDRIVIFTGDNKEVAADLARQLGIKEFYAECLPEDKFTRLKGLLEMQLAGDKLVFVGDGIDDAPILKMADVGIILGGFQSDEAVAAADMIFMADLPSKIATSITFAQSTNKLARQNIMFSFALKGLLLILVLLGIASIWVAALASVCLTLAADFNAMRAYGVSGKEIRKLLPKRKKDQSDE